MLRMRAIAAATVAFGFSHIPALAQEGPEVRAARVCVGIGNTDLRAQGPLHIDNLIVSGDANGTLTISNSTGATLGALPKGSYDKYVDCLTTITRLLSPQPQKSSETKTYKVCMGNGGGPNCLSGSNASYNCNFYNGVGGGAPKTYEWLAEQFCKYNDSGTIKTAAHHVSVTYDVGGGQCGWTAFQVDCYLP
jgi:hypothetical protein